MKKLLTFAAIAAIAIASTSQAANIFTGGAGAGDPSWFTAANWDIGAPGSGDEAWLDTSVGYGPIVDAAGATAASMIVGIFGHDGDLTINAVGELAVVGNIIVANDVADTGSIVNNGTLGATLTYLHAGSATLENNGTLNTTDLIPGHLATAVTTLSNTGDINATGLFYLTVAGDSLFNMNGGTVTVGNFNLVQAGTGHLQLDGGTIIAGALGIDGNANNTIDITEGVLIATGDHSGGLDWMAGNGAGGMEFPVITAYGGAGTVVADYDVGLNQTTLYAIPEPATLGMVALMGGGILWIRKRF